MKPRIFLDDRRDSAVFNCGMYGGLAIGWTFEPAMRWLVVPWLGDPPIPIVWIQTGMCAILCIAAGLIIVSRDRATERLNALPPIEERDE